MKNCQSYVSYVSYVSKPALLLFFCLLSAFGNIKSEAAIYLDNPKKESELQKISDLQDKVIQSLSSADSLVEKQNTISSMDLAHLLAEIAAMNQELGFANQNIKPFSSRETLNLSTTSKSTDIQELAKRVSKKTQTIKNSLVKLNKNIHPELSPKRRSEVLSKTDQLMTQLTYYTEELIFSSLPHEQRDGFSWQQSAQKENIVPLVFGSQQSLSESLVQNLKPGDVLVLHGGTEISSTIASIALPSGYLSHAAIVVSMPNGELGFAEYLADKGGVITSIQDFSKNFGARAEVLRPDPQIISGEEFGRLAFHQITDYVQKNGVNPPYKTSMDYLDMFSEPKEKMYCAEFVLRTLQIATQSQNIPVTLTPVRGAVVTSILGVPERLKSLFTPKDVLFLPGFNMVGSFSNFAKIQRSFVSDNIENILLNWFDQGETLPKESPIFKLATAAKSAKDQDGKISDLYDQLGASLLEKAEIDFPQINKNILAKAIESKKTEAVAKMMVVLNTIPSSVSSEMVGLSLTLKAVNIIALGILEHFPDQTIGQMKITIERLKPLYEAIGIIDKSKNKAEQNKICRAIF